MCNRATNVIIISKNNSFLGDKYMKEEIEKLKTTTGSKFFDRLMQKDFPEKDFYLCTEVNKFNFVLKVKKDLNGNLYIEKIDV